ncbi:hypothetical protein EW146_g2487 [Bondarzewia mesenterica]|uniref:Nucleoporin POM152 Ig-like domain-containing protein n=1 Tax=Bondarzewia mesenterica TaxID=1095465 RepID=A0A4S4M2F8_9AGAM|nr:hypothetical protein EW146_g2487 [Bondarzewia mesenterica]
MDEWLEHRYLGQTLYTFIDGDAITREDNVRCAAPEVGGIGGEDRDFQLSLNVYGVSPAVRTNTTRTLHVLRRPTVSFKGCGPGNPASLRISSEVSLTIFANEVDPLYSPWDVTIEYQPSLGLDENGKSTNKCFRPWKKTLTIQEGKRDLAVKTNTPGEYTVVDVKGKYCEGDVLSPEMCKVVGLPRPTAEIEWRRIHDFGDTGVSASLVLHVRRLENSRKGSAQGKDALQENAIYHIARTVNVKASKSSFQTPLKDKSLKPQKIFKDGSQTTKVPTKIHSRPLVDNTPFPNRQQNFVDYSGSVVGEACPTCDAGPSHHRARFRSNTRCVTLTTPVTNGNHWDVSDIQIDVPAVQEVQEAEVEDYDEIEYMPYCHRHTSITTTTPQIFIMPGKENIWERVCWRQAALLHLRSNGKKLDLPELEDDDPFALPASSSSSKTSINPSSRNSGPSTSKQPTKLTAASSPRHQPTFSIRQPIHTAASKLSSSGVNTGATTSRITALIRVATRLLAGRKEGFLVRSRRTQAPR